MPAGRGYETEVILGLLDGNSIDGIEKLQNLHHRVHVLSIAGHCGEPGAKPGRDTKNGSLAGGDSDGSLPKNDEDDLGSLTSLGKPFRGLADSVQGRGEGQKRAKGGGRLIRVRAQCSLCKRVRIFSLLTIY